MKETIRIGRDFSDTPFGRKHTNDDEDYSGEAFRKLLLKYLGDDEITELTVDLDDVFPGYEFGTSFLHEAFGGLILYEKLKSEDVVKKLKIKYRKKDTVDQIYSYIWNPKGY